MTTAMKSPSQSNDESVTIRHPAGDDREESLDAIRIPLKLQPGAQKRLYAMLAWGAAACALGVPAVSAGVTFTNVTGAASWVWVEAENCSSSSDLLFGPNYASSVGNQFPTDYSGWQTAGRNNAIVDKACEVIGSYFVNTFTVPMAMSSAQMYVHGYGDVYGMNVFSGTGTSGTKLASYALTGTLGWVSATPSLGALSAGETTLTQSLTLFYQYKAIDGFFLASQVLTT